MADDAELTRYADMLAAMGTEPRLRIMRLLLSAHPIGMVAGEIGEERRAVYGATADDPEKHFLGWADEVDADALFASGEACESAKSTAPGGTTVPGSSRSSWSQPDMPCAAISSRSRSRSSSSRERSTSRSTCAAAGCPAKQAPFGMAWRERSAC